jgi:hypothetical protein
LNRTIKKDHLASLEPGQAEKSAPVAVKTDEKKAVAKVKKAPAPEATVAEDQYGPFVDASVEEPKEPVKAQTTQAVKQPAVKEKTPSPVVAEANQAAAKEKPVEKPKQVAKADDEKADKKSSTSRFRRTPVTSKKIKGTLVAEFPKRLVIKYKARGHRDPFATLIDESKTNDGPIENQIPNVEGLKLVGVIEAGGKNNRALFEDNENHGYILQSGDKVQKGYVLRVESDRVYFQIFEYGWSRTVALHLES